MKTAVAYIRVSTEDQKLGPEAQRSQIEAFAKAQGLTITSWHVDHDVCSVTTIEERPGLLQALYDVRKTKASFLIVANRDRIARDTYITATIERALPKGATLIAANGLANGDTAGDQLMRTILDGMAQYERALIRARTKAALQVKKSKNERIGSIPYGYDVAPNGRDLIPNHQEQRTIERILQLTANGHSRRAIVALLTSEGITSRVNTPLGLQQVQRIIRRAA